MSEDYKKNEELEATQAENNEEKAEAIEQNNNSQNEADEVKSEVSANSPEEAGITEAEADEICSDTEGEPYSNEESKKSEKSEGEVSENAPEGLTAPSENAQSVSTKKMKKPLLISLIATGVVFVTALTLLLILFIPIWFGNPFINTFSELLPDTEVLEEVYSELQDSGYNEVLNISIPKNVINVQSGLNISGVNYAVGGSKDARGRMQLAINTVHGKINLDVSYDEEKITVGGISTDETYLTLQRKGISEALDKSVFAPDSGSVYALDEASYNTLKDVISGNNNLDLYADFFDDVLSEWEDIADKETKTSLAKGAFKLEREVTYKMSYGDICDMIDVFFEELEDNENIKAALVNGEIDSSIKESLKQSFTGANFEFSYRVIGSKLDRVCFIIDTERVDTIITLSTIYSDGNVGMALSIRKDTPGNYNDSEITLKYHTREDEKSKKAYITVSDNNPFTPDVDIYTFKYDKTAHTYKINLGLGSNIIFRLVGEFEIYDGKEGYRLSVDELVYSNKIYGTLEYEIKKDTTASTVKVESGIYILRASEDRVNEIIEGFDLESIALIIYDMTGEVIPGASVFSPQSMEEEVQNALFAFESYREHYVCDYAYYYSDTFNVYILMKHRYSGILYEIKNSISESEKSSYTDLKNTHIFILHSFELIDYREGSCNVGEQYTYKCRICGRVDVNSSEPVGHVIETRNIENYMHDDGEVYTVKLIYCTSCNGIDYFYIGDKMFFDFVLDSDGKLTNCAYTPHFAIPDAILEIIPDIKIEWINFSGFISVRIPDTMTRVPSGSFSKRTQTTKVIVIPSTVNSIENGAFDTGMPLEVILFEGTEEEWNELDLGIYRELWADVEVIFCPEGVPDDAVKDACEK